MSIACGDEGCVPEPTAHKHSTDNNDAILET